MNKKIFLFILIFFGTVSAFAQQQITKIGLINYSKIVKEYIPNSYVYENINSSIKDYEAEVEAVKQNIAELENLKYSYISAGDDKKTKKIEDQIASRNNYLYQYTMQKEAEIAEKKALAENSLSTLSEVLTQIQYIAESEGYSIIFDTNDKNIIWWSQSVDITELVLKRLKK